MTVSRAFRFSSAALALLIAIGFGLPARAQQAVTSDYIINAGDKLEVSVWKGQQVQERKQEQRENQRENKEDRREDKRDDKEDRRDDRRS